MSHKTTRKGGRSWWGKIEAKLASKVTRRRDDEYEIQAQTPRRPPRRICSGWFLWDDEMQVFHDQRCLEAWEMVTEDCSDEDVRFFNCRHNAWIDPDYAREKSETE